MVESKQLPVIKDYASIPEWFAKTYPDTADPVWLLISGTVYHVTNWLDKHPGGRLPILGMKGKDCTDPFTVFHPNTQQFADQLANFAVATVGNWESTAMQDDFFALRNQLMEEGFYKLNPLWYVGLAAFQLTICAAAVYLSLTSSAWYMFVLAGMLYGLWWQQVAFWGHDFGHNSFTKQQSGDWWGGIIVTLLFGVSGQWWKRSHNVHHILTNSVEYDPDIQHLPVFAVTKEIFRGFFSTYHSRFFKLDAIAQMLVPFQHVLYYPIMSVARVNLYLQSFLLVLNPYAQVNRRLAEVAALVGYWVLHCWYMTFLPSWTAVAAFMIAAHMSAGILHVQITLSHFAMDTYSGPGYEGGEENHFFKMQMRTTMDVECSPWMDWFHGGLQFQTTHHLLPRMPRHSLRAARERVRAWAKKHGLTYHSYGFLEGNKMVISQLKQAAEDSKGLSWLYQMWNVDG